jgi:D-arabinose 1-dehydrogenase-like Zn-dependent alcohol dehydrogenase
MIHHWGSMAEQAPVALNHCIALPDELDSVTAAAMANPGTSAYAGKLAVQIARYPQKNHYDRA